MPVGDLPTIRLTQLERELARFVAEQRQSGRVKAGVERDRYTAHRFSAVDLHTLGCEGELAFAKWSGRYWSGAGLDLADDDDVGGIQVRTRRESWHDLCIWPKDLQRHREARFVLVTKESDDTFCIRGWIWAAEATEVGEFRRLSKVPPSWIITQDVLREPKRAVDLQ